MCSKFRESVGSIPSVPLVASRLGSLFTLDGLNANHLVMTQRRDYLLIQDFYLFCSYIFRRACFKAVRQGTISIGSKRWENERNVLLMTWVGGG